MAQWLRLCLSFTGGTGSIPGQNSSSKKGQSSQFKNFFGGDIKKKNSC